MDRKTIWNYSQNKPTYIVRDLEDYVPADVVYESLLKRGVFKWLAVRRDLIRLKNLWRERVTHSIKAQKHFKKHLPHMVQWLRGYRAAMERCRREVQELCHSDRWQAPDHDELAKYYLKRLEGGEDESNT